MSGVHSGRGVCILLLLLLRYECGKSINVALHAQAPPSKDMVVGSTVTTAGLRQALMRRGQHNRSNISTEGAIQGDRTSGRHFDRGENITIFFPFLYDGLHDRRWDLVIIEGWFGMINAFIHEVRAISHPLPVIVLFYCLDPQYPGLPHVAALDVDGFLTNSQSTQQYLLPFAPTAFVPLAVDTEAFPFYPDVPCRASCTGVEVEQRGEEGDVFSRERDADGYGYGKVVYVGAAGLMEYKGLLAWMLREAMPYGLDIYGSGWQDFPEFSECWRGVLPEGDLASVYGTALAVIGVTTDAQRESGKINNRVFEALSVGAPLISDHFPALEASFGNVILYARRPGDVAQHIEALLNSCHSIRSKQTEANARQRRRIIIEAGHTWVQRVEDISSFVRSLPTNGDSITDPVGVGNEDKIGAAGSGSAEMARCVRQTGCLTLAILVDGDLEGDISFESTFVPAVDLLGSAYFVTWWLADEADSVGGGRYGRAANGENDEIYTRKASNDRGRYRKLPLGVSDLSHYDVVWAAGRWGGSADRTVRRLILRGGTSSLPRATTLRLAAQITGLVLWENLCSPSTTTDRDGDGNSPKNVVPNNDEGCPSYTGDEGLRWYDVVYLQTDWDHAFLMQQAFKASVSDNLQQAWGYEAPSAFWSTDVHVDESPLDVLVVGTDDQIQDMLRFLESPGLTRVALAILMPPGVPSTTTAVRPGIMSLLAAAGFEKGRQIDDLPQRLSVFVVESAKDSSFTPLATEIILVRRAADAHALAELASQAAKVVVVATGQLGGWAALVTNSGVHHNQRRGRQQSYEDVEMIVHTGDDNEVDGDRIVDLVKTRPGGWDLALYSRRLMAGMTRALCLGRGNSRIYLVRPSNEASACVVHALDSVVPVEVQVEDFSVGRDGQWCITVQGRTVLCILQNKFSVDLHISSSASTSEWEDMLATVGLHSQKGGEDGMEDTSRTNEVMFARRRQGFVRIEVVAELRSNMYQDVLRRSKPFHLIIDPTVGRAWTGNASLRLFNRTSSIFECSHVSSAGDDMRSEAHSSLRASIDTRDFLTPSNIVAFDVARVHDTVATSRRAFVI